MPHFSRDTVTLDFVVHYVTTFGQQIGLVFATGQRVTLGYDAAGFWRGRLLCDRACLPLTLRYKYELRLEGAEPLAEHCDWRLLDLAADCSPHAEIRDSWRAPGMPLTLLEAGGARATLFPHPSGPPPKVATQSDAAGCSAKDANGVTVRLRVIEPRLGSAGSGIVVCGSIAELGCWDPAKAQPMVLTGDSTWTWTIDLQIPVSGFPFSYKYLVRRPSGTSAPHRNTLTHLWEDGPNRTAEAPEFELRSGHGRDGSHAAAVFGALAPAPATSATSLQTHGVEASAPTALLWIRRDGVGVVHDYSNFSVATSASDISAGHYVRRRPAVQQASTPYADGDGGWGTDGSVDSEYGLGDSSSLFRQRSGHPFDLASPGSARASLHEAPSSAEAAIAASVASSHSGEVSGLAEQSPCILITDNFVRLETHPWKGAGVSVPLFSLRDSTDREGWPIGDFTCIPKLVDWAKRCGFKVIHMLPVNDTGSVGTDGHSSPYHPVSSCALHPAYVSLPEALEWIDAQAASNVSLAEVRETPEARSTATFATVAAQTAQCAPAGAGAEPRSTGHLVGRPSAGSSASDRAFTLRSPGGGSQWTPERESASHRRGVPDALRCRIHGAAQQSIDTSISAALAGGSGSSRSEPCGPVAPVPAACMAAVASSSSAKLPRVLSRSGLPQHGRGGGSGSSAASSRLQPTAAVDWAAAIPGKLSLLRDLYRAVGETVLGAKSFQAWFRSNREWLQPYALFCFFRDAMGTADPRSWGSRAYISQPLVQSLTDPSQFHYRAVGFWFFVQFLAHTQLERAAAYARFAEVMLVVDIPSGMPRSSADVWVWPHNFHLDAAMGAPPDAHWRDGQQWDYTPYNWSRMAADNYSWWRMRIRHLSVYFTGLRLSRAVEYFRTFALPSGSVTGLRGVFTPADGFTQRELDAVGLWDMRRLAEPHIREWTVRAALGPGFATLAPRFFVIDPASGHYSLRSEYDSERKIFNQLSGTSDEWLVRPLAQLLHNVCLFATRPTAAATARRTGESRLTDESGGAGLGPEASRSLLPEHVTQLGLPESAGISLLAALPLGVPPGSASGGPQVAGAAHSSSLAAVTSSDGAHVHTRHPHGAGASSNQGDASVRISPTGSAGGTTAPSVPSDSSVGCGPSTATPCRPHILDDIIFHPRFDMHASTSFLECDEYTRRLLSRVHAVYFSERQQDLWRTTGYLRLSALLRVCLDLGNSGPALFADDLGPQQAGCRETLRFLGIPGTDTHRLPRHDDGGAAASAARDTSVVAGQFQDPAHMEYGCWAMTSTPDIPSLRQWWEEDTSMAWGYFRTCVAPQQIKPTAASDASSPISLAPSVSGFPARRDDLSGSGGGASSTAATYRTPEQLPKQCTSEVATAMLRHYCASSTMLVVFPIQDVIAADAGLRHPDPHERINIPAVAKHVWRWRMPVTLDTLLSEPGRTLQSKLRLMLQEAARLGDL